MITKTNVHPDSVLEALISVGGRPQKIKNLNMIHDACRQQHDSGTRDFSLKTIGAITEKNGGIAWRSIYQTDEYKKLIEAWASYAGPSETKPKELKKAPPVQSFLAKIPDPSIRSIMEGVIIERDRLKQENNLLRELPRGVIDKRPLGATIVTPTDSSPMPVLTVGARLNHSEKEALKRSIDREFLEDQGWKVGAYGEIVNNKGRTIFEVGYVSAIRRILEEES